MNHIGGWMAGALLFTFGAAGVFLSSACNSSTSEQRPGCVPTDGDCVDSADCCEGVCDDRGLCSCSPEGGACTNSTECCGGADCNLGTCQPASTTSSTGTTTSSSSSASSSSSSTGGGCTDDSVCDLTTESCDCPDCTDELACGFGCTVIQLTDFQPANLTFSVDGECGTGLGDTGIVDGFQFFFADDTAVGLDDMGTISNAVDCGTGDQCAYVIEDNFAGQRYGQYSGFLDLTDTDPPTGILRNVVFFPSSTDGNNDITLDMDGDCLYLEEATIPTVP